MLTRVWGGLVDKNPGNGVFTCREKKQSLYALHQVLVVGDNTGGLSVYTDTSLSLSLSYHAIFEHSHVNTNIHTMAAVAPASNAPASPSKSKDNGNVIKRFVAFLEPFRSARVH